MKLLGRFILCLTAFAWAGVSHAQLEIANASATHRIFPGVNKPIPVVFHNAGNRSIDVPVRARTYVAASGTAAPLADAFWKNLPMLPGQTILETAPFDFPPVKAQTAFIVEWLEGATQVIGHTKVVVYPTNLLEELKPLLEGAALGLYDPQEQLKPLLSNEHINFEDLENFEFGNFSGRLAIFKAIQLNSPSDTKLARRILALAGRGAGIVWVQAIAEQPGKPLPSFYFVREKRGTVVVVQPELVADLADNPVSQLNLVYLCRVALRPENPSLLDLTKE